MSRPAWTAPDRTRSNLIPKTWFSSVSLTPLPSGNSSALFSAFSISPITLPGDFSNADTSFSSTPSAAMMSPSDRSMIGSFTPSAGTFTPASFRYSTKLRSARTRSAGVSERISARSSSCLSKLTVAFFHQPTMSTSGVSPCHDRDQLATTPSGASIALPSTVPLTGSFTLAEASTT